TSLRATTRWSPATTARSNGPTRASRSTTMPKIPRRATRPATASTTSGRLLGHKAPGSASSGRWPDGPVESPLTEQRERRAIETQLSIGHESNSACGTPSQPAPLCAGSDWRYMGRRRSGAGHAGAGLLQVAALGGGHGPARLAVHPDAQPVPESASHGKGGAELGEHRRRGSRVARTIARKRRAAGPWPLPAAAAGRPKGGAAAGCGGRHEL